METTITATELSRKLSDVLNRVKYRGERFVILKNGESVATIVPVGEAPGITVKQLIERIGNLPPVGGGFADDLEAAQREQGLAELPEWPD
jgi:prevent-host-death family protein